MLLSIYTIFLFSPSIPNVDVLQVDVTNEAHIAKAAEHVKQKYGKLELLINNAGLLHPSGLYLKVLNCLDRPYHRT